MRRLVATGKFKRAFRKFARNNSGLQKRIESILRKMELDVFASSLGTHKLSGKLQGLSACSCGYDCRIVFSLKVTSDENEEVIVLLDIGTHDDVY